MMSDYEDTIRAGEAGRHHAPAAKREAPDSSVTLAAQGRLIAWRREFQRLTGVDPRDGGAVKTWQAAHGLPPTGQIRSATIQAARAAVGRVAREPDGALAPNAGLGGAQGREALIATQNQRAYDAGRNAPREDFTGPVHRTVQTNRWEGYVDHRWGDEEGGRYQEPGERMVYASPSEAESQAELTAYRRPGQDPMANKTSVEIDYRAPVDPVTGRGGIAQVSEHLGELGLTRGALTEPKGQGGDHRTLLSRITGEDPYLHPRAVAQGARDAGASGLRVPSATGGDQLDVIPRNTDPSQLQYRQHQHYDATGKPGPVEVAAAHLRQHGSDGTGAGVMPAGDAPIPLGNKLNPVTKGHYSAQGSPGRTLRAGPVAYAAGGALAGALLTEVADHLVDGKPFDAETTATDVVVATSLGTAAGKSAAILGESLGGGAVGLVKGGGIIGGVIGAGASAYDNARAYRRGAIDGTRLAANVTVDATIGAGSGVAGAAIGAGVGSVVPVVGTAAGAALGFAVGTIGAWALQHLAYRTGSADRAKELLDKSLHRLGGFLHKTWAEAELTEAAVEKMLLQE